MDRVRFIFCFVAGMIAACVAHAQSTIDPVNKWAWAPGVGWIDCRVDSSNGDVIGQHVCTGYMYNPATGWIHVGSGSPTNGYAYSNSATNDYGVNHDGAGNLRGYGWSDSVEWIVFEDGGGPKVDLETGLITGLAYSPALGWISLSNALVSLQTRWLDRGPDNDADGIPDTWELAKAGDVTVLKSGEDTDGDGVNDEDEYKADTNPLDSNDVFAVESFAVTRPGNTAEVTWASSPTRLYAIETNASVSPSNWGAVAELGVISPAPDTNRTMRAVPGPVPESEFYRVRSMIPLAP